jgi:hypothetical protein
MRKLLGTVENNGMLFNLIKAGNQVEMQCQKYPEISQIYSPGFVLQAIQRGILTEVEQEKEDNEQ